jgi:glycosyltransferase involved in cell wall biosynthesis
MPEPKPLRVALCITELEIGGAERALVELAKRLDPSRFRATVYCLARRPTGNQRSLADELERAGIQTHYLGAKTVAAFPRTLRRLSSLLVLDRPDVMQTFLFHANVLGTWAARRAGVRHVLSGIRVAERRTWHRWLARLTDRWIDRHVCVSQAVADFSATRTGLPPEKLLVIPNGVDLARFQGAKIADLTKFGVSAGRAIFACVGRLEQQKGIDWLLDLMPQVFARHATHDLLVVGDGPQRAALERRTAALGIAHRVHFAGFQQNIPGILAACDCLVLPSRWEGMPNILLEAMAAGRPVLATAAEGVDEILGPEDEVQRVAGDNAQVFLDKLLTMLGQPALRARLGAANTELAEAKFSIGRTVAAYERLYESLR